MLSCFLDKETTLYKNMFVSTIIYLLESRAIIIGVIIFELIIIALQQSFNQKHEPDGVAMIQVQPAASCVFMYQKFFSSAVGNISSYWRT